MQLDDPTERGQALCDLTVVTSELFHRPIPCVVRKLSPLRDVRRGSSQKEKGRAKADLGTSMPTDVIHNLGSALEVPAPHCESETVRNFVMAAVSISI